VSHYCWWRRHNGKRASRWATFGVDDSKRGLLSEQSTTTMTREVAAAGSERASAGAMLDDAERHEKVADARCRGALRRLVALLLLRRSTAASEGISAERRSAAESNATFEAVATEAVQEAS
jgi:hypothetical protein